MERPPEYLKPLADRIARAAASEDAAEIVRLLRVSGLMGGAPSYPAAYSGDDISADVMDAMLASANSGQVGIWERKIENGKPCFVRRLDTMQDWYFWAHLDRIEPKGNKRRVLYMGESVARGYLYDPAFNPAQVLQKILNTHFEKDEVEVIDLARTNLGYEVRELALAALQLEPDVAIIFSGNNWGINKPEPTEIADIHEGLSTQGMAGVKKISEDQIVKNGKRVVRDVSAAYKAKGVPLIWMIPEFNLGDWRDVTTNAPYLAGDLNRQWLNLFEEAQSALRDRDFDRAEKLGQKIIEIDQGVCVAGFYILADCRRAANDLDGERKYLELARDAFCWDSSMLYIPRPYALTQQIMREEQSNYDYQLIDLPALLKQYLNGEIAGRRLFLDYCHLTTEGIQVAMGAAASSVLRSLKGIEAPWYALVDEHIVPSRETEAEASFLAAIHDAHRWQPYDVVRHFCARALSYSPHIAEVMLNYLALQTHHATPMRMSEAEENILRLGSPLIQRYIFRNNDKRLDKQLLNAIVEVLEENGIKARERLERLRREEHSVKVDQINLLDYYYCSSANQPQALQAEIWGRDKARLAYNIRYYRSYWPESKFIFVGEAGSSVRLCLTCRLPNPAPREAKIAIEVNNQPQVEILISTDWSTWDIDLPPQVMLDGLNEVSVRWPMPEIQTDEALSKATVNLGKGKFPDFYPIFGEIHTFTASNGAEVKANISVDQEERAVEVA